MNEGIDVKKRLKRFTFFKRFKPTVLMGALLVQCRVRRRRLRVVCDVMYCS